MMYDKKLRLLGAIGLVLGLVSCAGSKKPATVNPQLGTHQVTYPQTTEALVQKESLWKTRHGDDWKVELDPFTGFVVSATLSDEQRDSRERKKLGDVHALGIGKKFLEENRDLLGLGSASLDSANVAGVEIEEGPLKGLWEIVVQVPGPFPHKGFDPYELGDRVHLRLVLSSSGVVDLQSASPFPRPRISKIPRIKWDAKKIRKATGRLPVMTPPEMVIHVLRDEKWMVYRLAWRFALKGTEGKSVWVDAATGERLPTSYPALSSGGASS